jgi:hypothetical protein
LKRPWVLCSTNAIESGMACRRAWLFLF